MIQRASTLLSTQPAEWNLAGLSKRLVELSGAEDSASLTIAFGLVRQAQLLREPVAWITQKSHAFFPPDAARGGVDLNALAVVRTETLRQVARAADHIARSGAFGLIVVDLLAGTLKMAEQSRLLGLAKKHDTALLFLTKKRPEHPSLGSLISLRGQTSKQKTGPDTFTCTLQVIKDKRRAPGWRHVEVCRGPAGLH